MTKPAATPPFPTSLGVSTPETITLLGQDLAADLMGKVGFGELAFWLVALRRPTPSETRVFEAVLVALADHGFTPTAIAARLTYLSAQPALMEQAWNRLSAWISQGHLRPVVGHVLPMAQAADAYRLLLERKNIGKVVLRIV